MCRNRKFRGQSGAVLITVGDPIYQAKAHVLNQAIQEIGMEKYQVT